MVLEELSERTYTLEEFFGKERLEAFNKKMEEVRRDYLIKEAQSIREAQKIIVGPGPHNPNLPHEPRASARRAGEDNILGAGFSRPPEHYLAPKNSHETIL